MTYLLDTNIVLIYLRRNQLAKQLESSLQLLSASNDLAISVVSIGELKSIAQQNKWGNRKILYMIDMLNEFAIIDINMEEIIERYAEIDTYSQGKLEGKAVNFSARNMGKNDLWIAATASVYELELVTTDRDFGHLEDQYINLKTVDIRDYSLESAI
ncbi:MAG: PIN domain-containing protein [Bacteroidota bacterium]